MNSFEGGSFVKEAVEGVIGLGTPAFDLTYSFGDSPGLPVASGLHDERAFSDGTTVWTAIPQYTDFLPQFTAGRKPKNPFIGKKYLAAKVGQGVDGSGAGFGMSGGALGFSIGAAPTDLLGYLSGVGTAVEEGMEQIDGEEVSRYQVDLDLDALQRALPSSERTFDAYDFKPDVPHRFPAKVWLDRAGRLRKLTYRLDLSVLLTDVALKSDYVVEDCAEPDPELVRKAENGDRKAMAALDASDGNCTERPPRSEELVTEGSIEMYDYGTPLTISPPPASEVVTTDQIEAFVTSQAGAAWAGGPPATKGAPPKAPPTTRPRPRR